MRHIELGLLQQVPGEPCGVRLHLADGHRVTLRREFRPAEGPGFALTVDGPRTGAAILSHHDTFAAGAEEVRRVAVQIRSTENRAEAEDSHA